MGFCQFTAFQKSTKKAWRFEPSIAWYRKHDNGCAVSVGFSVDDGEVTIAQLRRLKAVEISWDDWCHSGCQSACVRRGAKECRW